MNQRDDSIRLDFNLELELVKMFVAEVNKDMTALIKVRNSAIGGSKTNRVLVVGEVVASYDQLLWMVREEVQCRSINKCNRKENVHA